MFEARLASVYIKLNINTGLLEHGRDDFLCSTSLQTLSETWPSLL